MNVQKNKTPPFELSSDLLGIFQYLESLPYKQRKLYIKQHIVSGYPPFFYRYVSLYPNAVSPNEQPNSIDKLRDILVNSSLWLSGREHFNDPFDTHAEVVIEASNPQQLREKMKQLYKLHQPDIKWIERERKINASMANQSELLANLTLAMKIGRAHV